MPFGWIAAATLGSGLLGAAASSNAASQQANAANQATQTQLQMFNTINNQQAPYRQAGQNALSALMYGEGLSTPMTMGNPLPAPTPQAQTGTSTGVPGMGAGQFTHQFNAGDLYSNLAPNYSFMLGQGLGAVQNLDNSTGSLVSGNTLRDINNYAQDYAGNAYQNAFNNYTTNQSNIFNRLATIAGLGQGANQITANSGTTLGTGIAGTQQAAGAAQAAGTVGSMNALTGGLNNAMGWYATPDMMKLFQ